MLCSPARDWRKARTLSAFRLGSSSRSSASKPGARRTSVAESSPPSRTSAAIAPSFRARSRAIFQGCIFGDDIFGRVMSALVHASATRTRGRKVPAANRLRVVNLFHGVHAAVGFGEQTLDVETILRTECRAHAQGNQIAAGNFPARFDGELIQTAGLFAGRFRAHPRSDDHEFISAHPGDIVVASAGFLQVAGKVLQQVVAFKVSIEIVNLLEVVEVADHY